MRATRLSVTSMQPPARHPIAASLVFSVLAALAGAASGYVEDIELERQLNASDANGLSQLPARRFKDGLAGFFRAYDLHVVPGTGRAWCQDHARGVLAPGCYVEFFFQLNGYGARTAPDLPCGLVGRWRRAPGSQAYVPTAGAIYAGAIAAGEWETVLNALTTSPDPVRLRDVQRRDDCTSG